MNYYVKKPGDSEWSALVTDSLLAEVEAGRICGDWRVKTEGSGHDTTVAELTAAENYSAAMTQSPATELELLQELVSINQKQLFWIRVVGAIVLCSWLITQIHSCSRM